MTIKFHLDENVHAAIPVGLAAQGIDVTTATDAGFLGADDEDHLAHSFAQGRVLVTHDHDFLALHAKGIEHAGIAYCHQTKYGVGEHLTMLILLHACYSAEDLYGRVEYL